MNTDPRPLVAHVIHHLVIGGMENGLVNLINQLPSSEFRHVVLCVEDFSEFRQRIRRKDVDVIALRRSRRGVMGMRRDLFRIFRELRPQIVHSRNQSGLDAVLPAWLAGVPCCVHGEHGWDVDNLEGRQWKAATLRRLHAPLVNRYIAVSKGLEAFLIERIGIARRRIITIHNGVDTEVFRPPSPASRPSVDIPEGFWSPGVVRVGTVGRLQPVKDQATLIAAVAALCEEQATLRSRLRLVLVGDGPLRSSLQQQVSSAGIAEITHFVGASDQVGEWLHAMDVFVLPSLNEGVSNTMLEAMATGLPTLVTSVGGNVELMTEGVGGRFFRPGDSGTLARYLLDYLEQPALRKSHGENARKRAESDFSLQTMVAGYRQVYRDLIASSAN